jgi:hypothetical protein
MSSEGHNHKLLISKPVQSDVIVVPSLTPIGRYQSISVETTDGSYKQSATVIECIECSAEHLPSALTLLSTGQDVKTFRNKMEAKQVKWIYFIIGRKHESETN